MAILCNGESIPVTIQVRIGDSIQKMVEFSPRPILDNGYFRIREHLSLAVKMTPDSSDVENVTLEIEPQQDMDNFIIKLGVYQQIYSYDERKEEEFPFRPGYTAMKLTVWDKSCISRVEVIPIYYTVEQVNAIHDYMEQQLQGICYDLINQKQMVDGKLPLGIKWYQEYARYHLERESEILSLLSKLENEQLKKLKKIYRPEKILKRTNSTGIRKTITKGAINGVYYNLKTVQEIDEKLAFWLKFVISSWLDKIEDAQSEIEIEQMTILVQEKELLLNQQLIERQKEVINQDRNAAKNLKRILSEDEKAIGRKKKKLDFNKKVRNSWQDTLGKIRRAMLFLLRETELVEIPIRFPKGNTQIVDPVLKQLRRLYEESQSMARNQGKNLRLTVVTKPTWQVFEYYVTVKIIEAIALTNYGFNITRGLEPEILEDIIERGIPQGSKFVLENEKYLINVVYDELLPFYENEAEGKEHDFYLMNEHRRPDIRVELYEKKGNGLTCKGIVVVDAKHRKFTNIYSKEYPKDTQCQLDNYYQITYRKHAKERGRKNKQIVDMVLCIFSGNRSDPPKHEAKYTYIRLSPELGEAGEITHTQGFTEIYQEIDYWLNSHICEINED